TGMYEVRTIQRAARPKLERHLDVKHVRQRIRRTRRRSRRALRIIRPAAVGGPAARFRCMRVERAGRAPTAWSWERCLIERTASLTGTKPLPAHRTGGESANTQT